MKQEAVVARGPVHDAPPVAFVVTIKSPVVVTD
jgi:hypothetical protein